MHNDDVHNNICMKLAKIAFLLLMKIWDSVYIFCCIIFFGLLVFYIEMAIPVGFVENHCSRRGWGSKITPRLPKLI